MTSPTPTEPVSYIKLLREIRDRIGEEIADMTIEERLHWHATQELDPELEALFARAKPPRPPRSKRPENHDE